MSDTPAVAPNSVDGLKSAVASYQKQQEQAQQQIAILDRNYQQQREQIVTAVHMLSGAMAALDQLIKNVEAVPVETQKPEPVAPVSDVVTDPATDVAEPTVVVGDTPSQS